MKCPFPLRGISAAMIVVLLVLKGGHAARFGWRALPALPRPYSWAPNLWVRGSPNAHRYPPSHLRCAWHAQLPPRIPPPPAAGAASAKCPYACRCGVKGPKKGKRYTVCFQGLATKPPKNVGCAGKRQGWACRCATERRMRGHVVPTARPHFVSIT